MRHSQLNDSPTSPTSMHVLPLWHGSSSHGVSETGHCINYIMRESVIFLKTKRQFYVNCRIKLYIKTKSRRYNNSACILGLKLLTKHPLMLKLILYWYTKTLDNALLYVLTWFIVRISYFRWPHFYRDWSDDFISNS